MKPLLVGESNPYGADPRYALYPYPDGCSGDRLARAILGMSRNQYLETFDRCNLCRGPWCGHTARFEAFRIVGERDVLVLLGARVSGAFGYRFEPFSLAAPGVLILPHPSGRCRVWNDPASAELAREAVGSLLRPTPRS